MITIHAVAMLSSPLFMWDLNCVRPFYQAVVLAALHSLCLMQHEHLAEFLNPLAVHGGSATAHVSLYTPQFA
jgi:hypothetical protein